MMRSDVREEAGHTYLHPGQIAFSASPSIVSTILGSCVALCLYDETTAAGGINHFLLPHGRVSARSGEAANAMLLAMFSERGIPTSRLKAKVFGGASMLAVGGGDLARKNVEVAVAFVREHDIALAGCDVGGVRGRHLYFRTSDGTAWVRQL